MSSIFNICISGLYNHTRSSGRLLDPLAWYYNEQTLRFQVDTNKNSIIRFEKLSNANLWDATLDPQAVADVDGQAGHSPVQQEGGPQVGGVGQIVAGTRLLGVKYEPIVKIKKKT